MNYKHCLFLLLLTFSLSLHAQGDRYPTDYFAHPLRLPVSMSGTFAEIRPNHFHSGIDLRIGGKVGEPVYAPADGYVNRIAISPWGGGQVLYITHANGYRTVYMHLNDYAGKIGDYVHDYQYAHEVYAFDIEVPKEALPIKKGQLIAHAGNTGSSGGPHLHYEIRYAENDQPINPLYFGMSYSDPIAPMVRNIKVYPADPWSKINGTSSERKMTEKVKTGKKSVTVVNDTFRVAGRFYTGIYATDVSEANTTGKNGVEKIELYVDDTLFFRYSVPSFLFEDTRVINALIDYPEYQRSKEYYVITRHLRGDRSGFSVAYRDNGYLSFGDKGLHKMEYRVSDYKGNMTRKKFYIRDLGPVEESQATATQNIDLPGESIAYFCKKSLIRAGFEARFEENTVYDNDALVYQSFSRAGYLGPLHSINLSVNHLPPHKAYTLRIAKPECDPAIASKMIIVNVSGKSMSACATQADEEFLTATVKSFGTYGVTVDTIAPEVKPVNFSSGGIAPNTLTIKITEKLSGIGSYHCYINGQWVLAAYDGKSSTLTIKPNAFLNTGENKLRVVVSDMCHNVTDLTYTLKK